MLDFILNTHGMGAYALVFTLLIAGAFGFPMPEDLALIAAGMLVHFGKAESIPMGVICYLGIVGGDVIIYRIGYHAGPALFRKRWFRRYVNVSRLQWIRNSLEKRTFSTILIARHLFYLRTATFLVCGAVRVRFSRFAMADFLAALITVPLMLWVGYQFAEHYDALLIRIRQVKISLLVVGCLTILYVGYRVWTGRKLTRDDDTEAAFDALEKPPSK